MYILESMVHMTNLTRFRYILMNRKDHIASIFLLQMFCVLHSFVIHVNLQVMSALKSGGWEGCLEHPDGWKESLQQLLCWGNQNIQDNLVKGLINFLF